MSYEVLLTGNARRDLEEIYDYIAGHDAPEGKRVYVYLIADGRRDMQTMLAQRLLGA
jgi:plasmid stabilization system protein ParE